MKSQSYVIRKEDLQDYEYDILVNICGAFDAQSSFAVKVPEIKDCLEVTKELNDGSEVMDCVGAWMIYRICQNHINFFSTDEVMDDLDRQRQNGEIDSNYRPIKKVSE